MFKAVNFDQEEIVVVLCSVRIELISQVCPVVQ